MVRLIDWSGLRATVEGRAGSCRCELADDGLPAFGTDVIPVGAAPDLRLLARFLRGPANIPPAIRTWLADLLDPAASSEFQFKTLSKRKTGRKRKTSASLGIFELIGQGADPIPAGATPDLKSIANFLHGTVDIPPQLRGWLADLFDPSASSEFQFKRLSKRKTGRKKGTPAIVQMGLRVFELMDEGATRQQAIGKVEEEFKVRRTLVEKAMKEVREAIQAVADG